MYNMLRFNINFPLHCLKLIISLQQVIVASVLSCVCDPQVIRGLQEPSSFLYPSLVHLSEYAFIYNYTLLWYQNLLKDTTFYGMLRTLLARPRGGIGHCVPLQSLSSQTDWLQIRAPLKITILSIEV